MDGYYKNKTRTWSRFLFHFASSQTAATEMVLTFRIRSNTSDAVSSSIGESERQLDRNPLPTAALSRRQTVRSLLRPPVAMAARWCTRCDRSACRRIRSCSSSRVDLVNYLMRCWRTRNHKPNRQTLRHYLQELT